MRAIYYYHQVVRDFERRITEGLKPSTIERMIYYGALREISLYRARSFQHSKSEEYRRLLGEADQYDKNLQDLEFGASQRRNKRRGHFQLTT